MLYGPDGSLYSHDREDIELLKLIWRGTNVLVLDDRDAIKRLEFNDKRRIADMLRKIFEQDFQVIL